MLEILLLSRHTLGIYLLSLSLIVLLSTVWFLCNSIPKLFRRFLNIPVKVTACLIVILLASAYVKIFVHPHSFGLYMDDYYPLEIANKVVMHDFNSLDPIFVANGVLFLPAFVLFGAGVIVGMYTMILVSMISLVLFFILGYLLTKDWTASLIATAFMSLYVSHVHYSFSAYNHTPVFFFTVLALVSYFLYFELKERVLLYVAVFSLLYLALMRVEMLLLSLFLFAFYMHKTRPKVKEWRTWAPWMLFWLGMIVLIPRFLFFARDLGNHPEIGMSSIYFLKNLFSVFYILDIRYVLAIFALVGVSLCIYRKNRSLVLVFLMALALLSIHLFMSYEQIQGARHLHFPASVIFLFAGVGFSFVISFLKRENYRNVVLITLLFGIMLAGIVQHVSAVKAAENGPLFNQIYFDTRLPEQAALLIPVGCTIVTPHPTKYLATTRIKAIAIEQFMPLSRSSVNDECYVFADDLSCTYPPENVKGKCDRIRERYGLEYLGSVDSSQIPTPGKSIWINASYYYIKP